MNKFTPQFTLEELIEPKFKAQEKLPGWLQGSEPIQQFFNTVFNHMFEDEKVEEISGYVGRRSTAARKNDFYIPEITSEREAYQLEPAMASIDEVGNVREFCNYQSLIDGLKFEGANTINHSRLLETDFWSWCPPIDVGMFINFSQYFWLKDGPPAIEITDQTNAITDIIGKTNYTTDSGLKFQSGIKIIFRNDDNTEFNDIPFMVENVGRSIRLVDFSDPIESEDPDYITIERGSQNGNNWSRTNRWIHKNQITDINLEDINAIQAVRPIIQFNANLLLRNFGRFARQDVDLLINVGVQAIQGQEDYTAQGVVLKDGMRILLTGGTAQTRNRIYLVTGLEQFNNIILVLQTEGIDSGGAPVEDETVYVKDGDNQGFYWYNGTNWATGQMRANPNTPPLFDLFDSDGTRLDDPGVYPGSTFNGSRIFGYQEIPTNPIDPILGMSISSGNFGQMSFENYIRTETFTWIPITQEPVEMNFVKFYGFDRGEDIEFEMEWKTPEGPTRQSVIDRHTIRAQKINGQLQFPREFKLSQVPQEEITGRQNYSVRLNQIKLVEDVEYELIDDDVIRLSLSLNLEDGDDLELRSYNRLNNQEVDGFYNIPSNLQGNPNNEEIEFIQYNDVFGHFVSIIENQDGLTGRPYGQNNFGSTGRIQSRGTEIIQSMGTLPLLMLHVENDALNIPNAIRYVRNEYIKVMKRLHQKIRDRAADGTLTNSNIPSQITSILNEYEASRNDAYPFANSGVIRNNSYIPASPAFLGMAKIYEPNIFTDRTTLLPTQWIRGHDGSLYNVEDDIFNLAVLELETKIFNSIPSKFKNTNPIFNEASVKPGVSRTSPYSVEEYNRLRRVFFEQWIVKNGFDFRPNTSFKEGKPFTWNWSTVKGYYDEVLPGNWRGIFQYYFDTIRPNTNPWEMLGFGKKPSWWDNEYGIAPYTGENIKMWNDIRDGYIRGEDRFDPLFERPDIHNYIPVDEEGNLKNPFEAGIAQTQPNMEDARENWKFGDLGPVEWLWTVSNSYSFDNQIIMYLLHPADYVGKNWNTLELERVFADQEQNQLLFMDTSSRITYADQIVHNEFQDRRYGFQQWVSDRLDSINADIAVEYGSLVRTLESRLSYSAGSFVKSDNFVFLTDNFGKVLDNDYTTVLRRSKPKEERVYSALKILWDGQFYRISGMDVINPELHYLLPNTAGKKNEIRVGKFRVIDYLHYSDKEEVIDYNTGFDNVQDVVNVIVGYGEWLKKQGWVFDVIDPITEELINWRSSARQFLEWADGDLSFQNQEFPLINLTPAGVKVSIETDFGIVSRITDFTRGTWSALDFDGFPIFSNELEVQRSDNKTTAIANRAIGLIRLNTREYEHSFIFNNRSRLDQIIYEPVYNLRQRRLRIVGIRTRDWNGRLDAPGFIINDGSLLSNIGKMATDPERYIDPDEATLDDILFDISRSNFGFQKTPYFENLFIDPRSQYNYYRGFIREKGTLNSLDRLFRSTNVGIPRDFLPFEEWAFKVGEYGSLNTSTVLEFNIRNADLKANPQAISFTTDPNVVDSPLDELIEINVNDVRWIRKSPDINLNRFYKADIDNYLPTAGYARLGDAEHIMANQDELDILFSQNVLNDGERIWLVKNNRNTWDMKRYSRVERIEQIITGTEIGDFTEFVFEDDHNLSEGDVIFVDSTDLTSNELFGVKIVAEVINTTTIKIESDSYEDFTFDPDEGPNVYTLKSIRWATESDFNSTDPPNDGWVTGDLAFVDDVNGKWAVYENDGSSWTLIREEEPRINPKTIKKILTLNNVTNELTQNILYWDPLKGKLPGRAVSELRYIIDIDPAKYTTTLSDNITPDAKNAWGKNEVGLLWWDTSAIRYLDYEQGSIEYRRKYWGRVLPGSEFNVYEWVRSPVPPEQWNEYVQTQANKASEWIPSGMVKRPEEPSWVEREEFDSATGRTKVFYYFWVKNPVYRPLRKDRRISANEVSRILESPLRQGIFWFAAIDMQFDDEFYTNSFILANTDAFITDDDQVLQLEISEDDSVDLTNHKQWRMVRQGFTGSIPSRLWRKLKESLIGEDADGNPVPDPNLDPIIKIGNDFRPRQTWFKDIIKAREIFVKSINKILRRENVVDQSGDWEPFFFDDDPLPQTNFQVESREERNLLSLNPTLVVGNTVVIIEDEAENNRWTLWEYAGGNNWIFLEKQEYKTSAYWVFEDWFLEGFENIIVSVHYPDTATRNAISHNVGNIVRVNDIGNNRWAWTRFTEDNVWNTVAIQDGTIRVLDNLFTEDIENDQFFNTEIKRVLNTLLNYFETR